MKIYILLLLIFIFNSCKENIKEKNIANNSNVKPKQEIKNSDTVSTSEVLEFKSDLRANEKLVLNKTYIDNVEFVGFNDDGDYSYFIAKKDKKEILLLYNADRKELKKYNWGDKISIEWKMDSIWIAGEDDRVDICEYILSGVKIKDGNVTLFKKNHKCSIKYIQEEGEETYTSEYLNKIYSIVEYYLANSTDKLVKLNLIDPLVNLNYSISKNEKDGREFTVINIYNEYEGPSRLLRWIYIDNETQKLYDYEQAYDKLIDLE